MKRIRASFRTIIFIIGIIAITFSVTSCAKSISGVTKNHGDPDINEEHVLNDGNNKNSNLSQSGSFSTAGDGKTRLTERYSVTASFLNVRKGASAESAKLGVLSKDDQVDVYGFKGNWAEIMFKGSKAFVSKNYIKKLEKCEPVKQQERVVVDASNTKSDSSLGQNASAFSFFQTSTEDSFDREYHDMECFNKYVIEAGECYFQNRYSAAARKYKKALKYKKDASVMFNLGISQFKAERFKKAKKAFGNAYEEALLCQDDKLAASALEMKDTSTKLAKEKSRERWLMAATISLIAVDIVLIGAANAQLQKLEMEQQKQQNLINNTVVNTSSYDYSDDGDYEEATPTPKKPKKCGFCNGRGWNVEYSPGYGLATKEYCSECGKVMMSNHYHETCTHCNGTGYR